MCGFWNKKAAVPKVISGAAAYLFGGDYGIKLPALCL
jgi:hypothetical protein